MTPARRRAPIPLLARASSWVLALLLAPQLAAAQDPALREIGDGWSFAVGAPGEDRAAPGLDDRTWPVTSLTAPWREQGLEGRPGTVWYRKRLSLGPVAPLDPLAILVGPMHHGSWELFADGALIGSHGSEDNPIPYPRARVVRLPGGVLEDAEVVLALRVHRPSAAAASGRGLFPAVGGVTLGHPDALQARVRTDEVARKHQQLGAYLFAVMAILAGLFHVFLFAMRPAHRTYLWFGSACVAFGLNALAFSAWTASSFESFSVPYRLTTFSGHLATALLLLFLWQTFGQRLGRIAGPYVGSHVVLAVVVLAMPFGWVVGSEHVRFFWLLPGLGLAAWSLGHALRGGHPDARYLCLGLAAIAAAQAGEFLRLAGAQLPSHLPYWGFTFALIAVAAMLAGRFSRIHAELEELRLSLEATVAERTAALEDATRRANAANESKSRFVAKMSHELRTPLNAVIGFAAVLLKEAKRNRSGPSERELYLLERIRSNGQHLLALVDQILDLSLIEAGSAHVQFEEVDVGMLITRVLADVSPQAVEKGLGLTAVVPTTMSPIQTDPMRLRQILANLVDNAIRFTDDGSVTLSIRLDGRKPRWIEVSDTGAGIPPEKLAEIVHGFVQGDDTTRRTHGGLGLGLTIASGVSELLGCSLSIDSEVGEGTSVSIDLDPSAPVPPPAPATVEAGAALPAHRPRVNLVVESGTGSDTGGSAGGGPV